MSSFTSCGWLGTFLTKERDDTRIHYKKKARGSGQHARDTFRGLVEFMARQFRAVLTGQRGPTKILGSWF